MKTRNTVIFTIILLLLIPLFQQLIKPIKVYKLMGHYDVYPSPQLNDSTWFLKEFQVDFEKYMNQNFGFRNIFVRLRNQIDWDLFHKINTTDAVVGKQDFLFEKAYINSYKGRDYIGDSIIEKNAKDLKKISSFLSEINTSFLIVIAPGKGWYYPELMPDNVSHLKKVNSSNYEKYIKELAIQKVHFIDFNAYLLSQKDSLGSLLYPKTGIHWSNYGAALALDSIAKYASIKFGIDVPEYSITKTDEYSTRARHGDKDLENAMNLLKRMENYPLIYPEFKSDSNEHKPKVLIISDSFFYAMRYHIEHVFDYNFWYYYDKHWPTDLFTNGTFDELKEYYKSYDLVILLCTEAGLTIFPWGMIEDMGPVYAKLQDIDQLVSTSPSIQTRSSK